MQVLTGPDQGKQGIISQVIEERNWVIVEGLNAKYMSYGKTKDFPGIVMKQERPLLVRTIVYLHIFNEVSVLTAYISYFLRLGDIRNKAGRSS